MSDACLNVGFLLSQLFMTQAKGLHNLHGLVPEWPPAGSMHSLGASPRLHFGTPPFGKSVDMVDVCTQLMEQGSKQ
jgi:hypothetical protein